MKLHRNTLPALALCATALLSAGCADRNKNGQPESLATEGEIRNSVEGASRSAQEAADKAAPAVKDAGRTATNLAEAATVTPQVKLALQQNPSLAKQKIDVDTLGAKDTVALRGTVQNQAQKELASAIAKKHAPGYKLVNQLKVAKP